MTTLDVRSDPVIADLAAAAGEPEFAAYAADVRRRLERQLDDASDTPMTWEPVPLAAFSRPLPPEIASCWVFVLRPGAALPAERHSNSHQRSLSLKGTGTFELRENGRWVAYPIKDSAWASAPTGMWHRWFAGPEPLALLSFHTVRAEDLIEEHATRPEDYDGPSEGRRYLV
jgi:hypothetical protein